MFSFCGTALFWFEMMLQGQHCKCAGLLFFARVYEKKKRLEMLYSPEVFFCLLGRKPRRLSAVAPSLTMLVLTHFVFL